jgi:hypothetical protein
MAEKYLHYFGNESSESILEEYGIVPTDKKQSDILKPKICPNCNEGNIPDSKFCSKCRMILIYDAVSETLASQDKINDLEETIKSMEGSWQSWEAFKKEPHAVVAQAVARRMPDNHSG